MILVSTGVRFIQYSREGGSLERGHQVTVRFIETTIFMRLVYYFLWNWHQRRQCYTRNADPRRFISDPKLCDLEWPLSKIQTVLC